MWCGEGWLRRLCSRSPHTCDMLICTRVGEGCPNAWQLECNCEGPEAEAAFLWQFGAVGRCQGPCGTCDMPLFPESIRTGDMTCDFCFSVDCRADTSAPVSATAWRARLR